jgi:glucose/arabinose dehydrogenase
VAAKSMKREGTLLRECFIMNKSIPVERPRDLAKYGDGSITFCDNL